MIIYGKNLGTDRDGVYGNNDIKKDFKKYERQVIQTTYTGIFL